MRKKAIVTGGSHGIGKAIVERLAAEGYDVVFSYNSHAEEAQQLVQQLNQKQESKVAGLSAKFEKKETAARFFAEAVKILGSVDVLVNNAGITRFESLTELTDETLDLLIALDLRNYIAMMREAAVYMKAHRIHGSIVNITSSRGQRAYPGDGVYGACKAALNRAAESFALDMAPLGIRINNVAPGATRVVTEKDEPENYKKMQDVYEVLGARVPMGRMGAAGDIAAAVSFLISEQASYITGITLRVDGGLILPGLPEYPDQDMNCWGWKNKM